MEDKQMKPKKMNKRLFLNKKTITNISLDEMRNVKGGTGDHVTYGATSCYTLCNTYMPTACQLQQIWRCEDPVLTH